ncbi:dockerin type I domain-containing protein [Aliiglaciecola lipolytica]|uniref:Dockerin domain-containing protein n=1 Tax=Aliiglaciecola lipolytica E3 TaxID=1127673 RepID=K6XXS6_9ALTE|nr:dockerin type I domain-containing protein [Aliiglaciecola lipolytica]GAC16456.1 hypothetical protein GLIP_3845 [Aliiglaciecola lipolytica E3]
MFNSQKVIKRKSIGSYFALSMFKQHGYLSQIKIYQVLICMSLGLHISVTQAQENDLISPPGNWTYCIGANETCEFDGSKQVAFGLDGQFAYQVHQDGVYCATSVFGDPLPGKRKHCWKRNDTSHLTPPEGAGWLFCIGERNTCSFTGTFQVAFGRDGKFAYQTHQDGVSCTNAVFGDAAPGKYKHCWVRKPSEGEPEAPEGPDWTFCANEGDTCYLDSYHEVAYGRDGAFNYEIHNSDVVCANSEFGDPIPGRAKYCWIREVEVENTITIDLANPKQEITLMGSDMERSQFFLNNATNSQQIADWVFKDIAFDYSRVSYDRKQELVEGSPNLAFYDRAVSSMKMVKQANPNVKFWATLKSDYDGYGTTNNLPDWVYTGGGYNGGSYDPSQLNVEKYARFLSDYLKYMSDNGVEISVLSVVKEWTQVVSAVKEVAVINEIKRLLATSEYAGVPEPEFSGPSTWGTKQAVNVLNSYINQNALDLFKGISTHAYDGATEDTWTNLVNTANSVDLPVWHTETGLGTGPTSGVELDISMPIGRFSQRAMWYRAGMQGELFFEPWSRGIGRETRAIYFRNNMPGERYRAYYIMKQFGNHAPMGSHYLATNVTGLANAETMAFRSGNKVILWVMNNNETAHADTTIHFNGEEISSANIEQIVWHAESPSSGDESTISPANTSSLDTEITGKSITSFVFYLPEEVITGDVNGDGEITVADITAFVAVYGLSSSDEGYIAAADLDGDGVITRFDYSQLYSLYRLQ